MKNKEVKQKKNKKEKKKKSKFWIVFTILLIIIAIAGIVLGYKIKKNGGGMQGVLATMVGHDEETKKNLEEIQFLILGISTDVGGRLTDTIMIGSYYPKTQEAGLLSIPRDTFVGKNKNYATASDKINTLYKDDNPDEILEAVNDLTGLDLKYYVTINTNALIELVDTIGGINFDVPIDMDYDDPTQDLYIHLNAGYQLLNGSKAEQLLRFRHNNDGSSYPVEYGDNDLGRMRTQRAFITELIKQTITAKNVFKIRELIDVVFKNIDTNISLSLAKDYVPYVVEFSTDNFKTATLPGTAEKCNGVWIYTPDKKDTKSVVSDLFESDLDTEDDNTNTISNTNTTSSTNTSSNGNTTNSTKTSKIKLEVLNGSGKSSTLSKVIKKLETEGYNVTKSGSTSLTSKTTIINKKDSSDSMSQDIKSILGTGVISNSVSSSSTVNYTIIIGKDYNN